jgi:hypothetical protein
MRKRSMIFTMNKAVRCCRATGAEHGRAASNTTHRHGDMVDAVRVRVQPHRLGYGWARATIIDRLEDFLLEMDKGGSRSRGAVCARDFLAQRPTAG